MDAEIVGLHLFQLFLGGKPQERWAQVPEVRDVVVRLHDRNEEDRAELSEEGSVPEVRLLARLVDPEGGHFGPLTRAGSRIQRDRLHLCPKVVEVGMAKRVLRDTQQRLNE